MKLTDYYSLLLALSKDTDRYAYDEGDLKTGAIIPFTGGAPTKVFDFPSPFSQIIRWATDGRALTYIGNPLRANLFRQPVDGGPPKQITDFKSDRIFIYDWSRDGKNLAVARGGRTSDVVLITDQTAFK